MKKRLLCMLLALTLALTLTACGGKNEKPADTGTGAAEETDAGGHGAEPLPEADDEGEVIQEDPTPTEEAEQPSATEEKPAQQNQTKPVEKPAGQSTQKPAPEQSTSAAVDLTAFYTALSGGSSWPAMVQMESETLDTFYAGLSAVPTNQCSVYMAMISANVGELALVEVQNAADVETVKAIFQARIDYQVGDDANPGAAWYPESIEGWKNNSRIVSSGNYVMLVAMDGADGIVTDFQALFA